MNEEIIATAVGISKKTGNVIVATCDAQKVPHIAVAGPMETHEGLVAVTAWYCPMTLANLEQDPNVAIAVWQKETDSGYQILGQFEKVRDTAVMDGYTPLFDSRAVYPQIERQLLIRVKSVLFFSQALHADTAQ